MVVLVVCEVSKEGRERDGEIDAWREIRGREGLEGIRDSDVEAGDLFDFSARLSATLICERLHQDGSSKTCCFLEIPGRGHLVERHR